MQLINRFDRELTLLTYNVEDQLLWVPFSTYKSAPNSRLYVSAHDNGKCRLRFFWSEHGGKDLGLVSEDDVIALVPPPARTKEGSLLDGETGETDSLSEFMRNEIEKVRFYYFDLPWHRADQPPQSPQ